MTAQQRTYEVLAALATLGGRATAPEVARRLGLDRAWAHKKLTVITAMGLTRATRDTRRGGTGRLTVTFYSLTEAGEALLRQAARRVMQETAA